MRLLVQLDTDSDKRARAWIIVAVVLVVVLLELIVIASIVAYILLARDAVETVAPPVTWGALSW